MNLSRMQELAEQHEFSGVVRILVSGETVLEFAAGSADRANDRRNTVQTRFGTASVTKGLGREFIGTNHDELAPKVQAASRVGF